MIVGDESWFRVMKEAGWYEQDRFHELRPITPAEVQIAAALAPRKPSLVKAGNALELQRRGYSSGKCHHNCMTAAAVGEGEHVFGWTVMSDRYLSHSILRLANGELRCITPDHTDELDATGCFSFVEDDAVTCDGERMFWRGEWLHPFNTIIRKDPEAVRARCQAVLERVRRGEIGRDDALKLDGDAGPAR